MAREKKDELMNFTPYSVEYIGNLLGRLTSDVQDNMPISDEDYLKLAVHACQSFNEILGDETFDTEG